MSKYQLKVLKLVLKKGSEQLVDDFYNYQAVFLFLPSFHTDQNRAVALPKFQETQSWQHSEMRMGAEDTRQLQPISFDIDLPPFEQLTLRLNLVQHLKDSFDQWGALQKHLSVQKGTHSSTENLNSVQLIEVVFPAVLLGEPTTIQVQNKWLELEFKLTKQSE